MTVKIAPSILSADFGKINEEIASVEEFCELIHIDVMDGHFVPNLTFGAPILACMRSVRPFDVHLMIENPEKFIDDFAEALRKTGHDDGRDIITVHSEAVGDLKAVIEQIHALGLKAGVSIKPGTDVDAIKGVLADVDLVLIMTVEPGFGGQKFMSEMMPKVLELQENKQLHGYEFEIAVDGGINAETARICREAGADILIAGSYIFGAGVREEAILSLR